MFLQICFITLFNGSTKADVEPYPLARTFAG